jgi:hypothetical protein
MRRLVAATIEDEDAEGEGGLVRRYPPDERERDDLRELLAEVDEHFGALDRAIHDAGNYRTFFLILGFLRDATLPGYKFVIEWEKPARVWTVGYRRKNKRGKWRRMKDILLRDEKIDAAIGKLVEVWKGWAEAERAGTGDEEDG